MVMLGFPLMIAGLLHIMCAGIAKVGQKGFDNHNPRQWMATFQGYRARANAAQANTLESLPFFYAAALFALYTQVDYSVLTGLLWAWLACRFIYIIFYIKDLALLRSLIWFIALLINIFILFSANFYPAA